jgi:4'-phosphopantetheinyl transferase
MIRWLVQSVDITPRLEEGLVPPGLLSNDEQAKYANLKTAKRRRDWLLGRWTAKHLLQEMMADHNGSKTHAGRRPPLEAIVIKNQKNGAPIVSCHWESIDPGHTVSISHSNGHAFCAAVGDERPLGADMERIEPRADCFVHDYFTPAEIGQIDQASKSMRDVLVTATWSAKEAALKAWRLGLAVDTRAVTCLLRPIPEPPLDWTPYDIHWDEERMNQLMPPLAGWWRVLDSFVLTIAAGSRVD